MARNVTHAILPFVLFAFLTFFAGTLTLAQRTVAPTRAEHSGFAGPRPNLTAHSTEQTAISILDRLAPLFSKTYSYDSAGSFATLLAVGDLNGDGWSDLVVVNRCAHAFVSCTTEGSVAVLLGEGDGTYLRTIDAFSTGLPVPNGLVLADVNGDRKLDVLVSSPYCNNSNSCVGVLLGNGNGMLQPVTESSSSWTSILLAHGESAVATTAVADVNGDGNLDMVTVSGGSVSLMLGKGDGTFQPAVVFSSGGDQGTGVAVADLNGDGNPDTVVSSLCYDCASGLVSVLLGNGDGTFRTPVTYSSGAYNGLAIAVADMNGDGIPDILVGNLCGDTCSSSEPTGLVGLLLGNGDGTFQPALEFNSGGVGAEAILAVDLNGDGKPDIAVANDCYSYDSCPGAPGGASNGMVGVLLNQTPYTATTLTLTSSLNPSTRGQSVTFTATLRPFAGTALDGETILFKSGSTVLGTVPLSSGVASFTTSTLPTGASNLTATYAFDGTYGASSARLRQTVNATTRYSTTTSLSLSPNPSALGQIVTCIASVKSYYGPIPDGELVAFYSDTTSLGSAALSSGMATFQTTMIPANSHKVRAVYPGDPTRFQPSSATATQFVNGLTTDLYLSSSLNPSIYGQKVTLTATMFAQEPPTGKVKFTWDRFTLGSAPLFPGGSLTAMASLTIPAFNADNYPLIAVFPGDDKNAPAASDVLNQVVLQTTSSATITSSLNPSLQGQPVTFTAKITSPTVTAKGPVSFTSGKTILGSVQLVGGKATLTISTLPSGITPVTVTYLGNSNIAGSVATISQIVK